MSQQIKKVNDMSVYTMKGEAREGSSKGAARRLRVAGKIPAVIYGAGKEPKTIAVTKHSLQMATQKGGFFTNAQEIDIDGKVEKVLPRELQRDPVLDQVIHADFLRFDPNKKIKVNVRVHVVDEDQSAGIKKGGVLSLVRNELELLCKADSIPDVIDVSVATLDVGHAVKMSEVTLPEGVEPVIADRDFTIATVLSTRASTLAEGAESDVAEADGESSDEAASES